MKPKEYNLTQFTIDKLHGEFDYVINIVDNQLVIVSENGMGKTTVVNIIYYSLSRQWNKLLEYKFGGISVTINNHKIELNRDEILDVARYNKHPMRNLRRYPPRYRKSIERILNNFPIQRLSKMTVSEIIQLGRQYDIEAEFLMDYIPEIVNSENQKSLFDEFDEKISLLSAFGSDTQILYLPTYRRIEQDLTEIFPELETNLETFRRNKIRLESQNRPYLELVEFGMEDVQDKIKNRLIELNNNLNNNLKNNLTGTYLKDIINGKYRDFKLDDFREKDLKSLNEILDRIDSSILSDHEKQSLRDFVNGMQDRKEIDDDNKILGHFIMSLMDIYDKQKLAEKDIDNFMSVCAEYMVNKTFVYDREDLEINILLNRNMRPILLKNLSSGEKQIVSLFSHLYLSKEKKYFVIIDEPELSLSVLWQQRLLTDIVNSNFCSGMLAVTHSPFIFKNELKSHTHSLEEFRTISQ